VYHLTFKGLTALIFSFRLKICLLALLFNKWFHSNT